MTDKETAPHTLDVAAEHIQEAQKQMGLAANFIPDGREKAVAKTHFDTALLWLAEAINVAKLREKQLEEIKSKPRMV